MQCNCDQLAMPDGLIVSNESMNNLLFLPNNLRFEAFRLPGKKHTAAAPLPTKMDAGLQFCPDNCIRNVGYLEYDIIFSLGHVVFVDEQAEIILLLLFQNVLIFLLLVYLWQPMLLRAILLRRR